MRILVTGSEGHLMQAVIPHLLNNGHEVFGVDMVDKTHGGSYGYMKLDLREKSSALVSRIMSSDAVIHSAAMVLGAGAIEKYKAEALIGNTLTAAQFANALLEAKSNGWNAKRLVYLSSSCVYDGCTPPAPEEIVDTIQPPTSGYGLSKLIGERLFAATAKKLGCPYTFWRPFNIVTPFERPKVARGDGHVVADLIKAIAVDGENPVTLYGGGSQVRCFTWYGDVAEAIAETSLSAATENEAINLGTPKPVTIAALAEMIFNEAKDRGLAKGEFKINTVAAPSTDVPAHIPHVDKATRLIGWMPETFLPEMISACFDNWFGVGAN